MSRRATHLALLLALAHLGLSAWRWWHPEPAKTYVFTPLIDVWVEGPALTQDEAHTLGTDLRHGVEARNMQQAYATLGSTLSLADLLEGVKALAQSPVPLSAEQARRVRAILDQARSDHAALVDVQRQILDSEADVARQTRAIQSSRQPPRRP